MTSWKTLRQYQGILANIKQTRTPVITVSKTAATKIQKLGKLPSDQIQVIYNGVDPLFYNKPINNKPKTNSYHQTRFTILHVGGTVFRKDLFCLLKGVVRLPAILRHKVHLKLVGDYNTEDYLTTFIKKHLAEQTELIMGPSLFELRQLYQEADLFCFPSLAEGFGLPVLEAMASGTPVLASDIPEFKEITNGRAVFFKAHDSGDLAAKLQKLMEDTAYLQKVGSLGPTWAQKFTWQANVRQLLQTYDRILA
jgi:glycosyltransferase involved in cell wall biosynthesis